jgi:S-formylglutathione hydrolase FrmB
MAILSLFLLASGSAQISIRISIDSSIHKKISGRLYLFTQNDTTKRVPNDPDPAQSMFVWEVKNLSAATVLSIDKASGRILPAGQTTLPAGYYKIAGVIDTDFEERGSFNDGNIYARKEAMLYVNEKGEGSTEVVFESVIRPRKFRETALLKELSLRSVLLSDFRKKDITLKAAVRLPASYHTDTAKRFPVVFVIPGWGGTHYDMMGKMPVERYGMDQGKEKIFVYLNPETQSPFGLHAFVDSRVNGPWGRALVEEMIPHIEEQFRVVRDAGQRFIMGQSTGGYASLWLQLHYPSAFGGCWSVSPDPVDFSAFIGINLYEKGVNFYVDQQGAPRPFFLINGKPLYTMQQIVAMETLIGDGEQTQAFEAEFGLPDHQGRPRQLFDRKTGKVHASVVKSWEPYDLGRFIQRNWSRLSAQLRDKVHIYAGANDNFFLQKAVQELAEKAKKVNAHLIAELIPNADHWSIWSLDFTKRVQAEIDARIR